MSMGVIKVINLKHEPPHQRDGIYFYIGRDRYGNILGNPFTSIKTNHNLALYVCNSREESIEKYREYFHTEIQTNQELRSKILEIYRLYEQGETIYLGCFCKPLSCHGDIIKEFIEKTFLTNQEKNV